MMISTMMMLELLIMVIIDSKVENGAGDKGQVTIKIGRIHLGKHGF